MYNHVFLKKIMITILITQSLWLWLMSLRNLFFIRRDPFKTPLFKTN